MFDWLTVRRRAVDDAKRDTPFTMFPAKGEMDP